MREEIEAAAIFITKLVNKNLSSFPSSSSSAADNANNINSAGCSSASSSSGSSTTSDSPPGFLDLNDQSSNDSSSVVVASTMEQNNNSNSPTTPPADHQQDSLSSSSSLTKVELFKQCLTNALYERFQHHWFPDQPTKGQAYRCIRLNKWDRKDIILQRACLQCGIDYKDLQLPVELTLWVDPDEVTCRFGENKGSHCLVARFKDGELKEQQLNVNNYDENPDEIELFSQHQQHSIHQHHHHHNNNHQQQQQQLMTNDRMRHTALQGSGSPDYHKFNMNNNNIIMNNNSNNNIHNSFDQMNYPYQQAQYHNHHHQPQTPPQQQRYSNVNYYF